MIGSRTDSLVSKVHFKHDQQQRHRSGASVLRLCQKSFCGSYPLDLCRLHCIHRSFVSTWHKLVFLASFLHDTSFLLPHDRSCAPLLTSWLPHQKVFTQDQRPCSLGPAGPLCVLCGPGPGCHLLQQTPQREAPLHLVARPAGPVHGVRGRRAVFGGPAPHVPFSGQRLVPRQTEALPRGVRTRHLPAWQWQPAPRPQLDLVHCSCQGTHMVPVGALPCFLCPHHHEPSLQFLHG